MKSRNIADYLMNLKTKGLTQLEIAKKMGYNKGYLSGVANGSRPISKKFIYSLFKNYGEILGISEYDREKLINSVADDEKELPNTTTIKKVIHKEDLADVIRWERAIGTVNQYELANLMAVVYNKDSKLVLAELNQKTIAEFEKLKETDEKPSLISF